MRLVGLGERPEFRLDIEHPATAVRFGAEVTLNGTSTETAYTYGVNPEVTRNATAVITGGESYTLKLPPVTVGDWVVTVRTNYGVVAGRDGIAEFKVTLPTNSELEDEI